MGGAKIAGSEASGFVYNAGGMLVAEYSTEIEGVETAQVSYLTQDHLGSPRVVTDKNGAVLSRKDYSAFGEELNQDEHRTENEEYGGGEVRKGYTGYEKDSESGLEFAQARYYNTIHGRFTTVDPLNESGSTDNPQTFNRYTYVINDPLNLVDPGGMMACSAEYSYSDCGGDKGFWGGGEFGDQVAYDKQTLGNHSSQIQAFVSVYLERISNSQAGYGFISNSEAMEAMAVAFFNIFYDSYEEDDPQAAKPEFHRGAITVYQFMPRWDQAAHIIRDATAPIMDTVMPGFSTAINWTSQRLWGTNLIHTESREYQDADTVVAISGVFLPGPGGKAQLAAKLGTSVKALKHATKHLTKFQALRPGTTAEGLYRLGQRIASNPSNYLFTKGGMANYQRVVNIGGQSITVRVALNPSGKVKSIHIRR
ncbi:MAG: RHS repeat domain-containing protein [Pyrinomonadaceae bacterium]